MDKALTPKQEYFAMKYIETGNASEAYQIAYDAENMKPVTIRRKAKELLDNGKVAACIRALRDARTVQHIVTVDTITKELDESRQLATAVNQHSAAINASLGKAKLHGLITDKQETHATLTVSTKEQRDAAVAAALASDS